MREFLQRHFLPVMISATLVAVAYGFQLTQPWNLQIIGS